MTVQRPPPSVLVRRVNLYTAHFFVLPVGLILRLPAAVALSEASRPRQSRWLIKEFRRWIIRQEIVWCDATGRAPPQNRDEI